VADSRRPIWFGLILGVGFSAARVHHLTGLAVGAVALMTGAGATACSWTSAIKAFATATAVWLVAQQGLRRFAPGAGPGTLASDLHGPANNLLELRNRFCFDLGTLTAGFGRLVTQHWPRLFGTEHVRAFTFGLESNAWLGISGVGVVLAALASLALVRIATRVAADRAWLAHHPFGAYLTLVGALSAVGFVVGRCGYLEQDAIRSAIAARRGRAHRVGPRPRKQTVDSMGGSGTRPRLGHGLDRGHAAIWAEYTSHPPPVAKNLIVKHLEASGIRYARSDYWIAYWVTFATRRAHHRGLGRGLSADRDVPGHGNAHAAEAVRISREPCGTTRPAFDSVYFCPP
jgi:hypothetical protein